MPDSTWQTARPPEGATPHAWGPNLHLHGEPWALSLLARLGHEECQQPEVGRIATRLFDFRRTGQGPEASWTINGLPFRPGSPLARPRLGTTEV